MNSIIEGLQAYFEGYTGITGTGSPVLVDFLGMLPKQYSIVPLDGSRIVNQYLDGSKDCQFPFAFQSMNYTLNDVERMDASGFIEDLADWLDAQTVAGVLPTLPAGKTADELHAVGHAYLAQEGKAQTGVYQIQCLLSYKQS